MLRRPQNTVRDKLVGYRATQSEINAIERAAKKSGKSTVSEWLREIVKKELDRACV